MNIKKQTCYVCMQVPRFNFDNFYWSLVTVFQVISGENWNETMYEGW